VHWGVVVCRGLLVKCHHLLDLAHQSLLIILVMDEVSLVILFLRGMGLSVVLPIMPQPYTCCRLCFWDQHLLCLRVYVLLYARLASIAVYWTRACWLSCCYMSASRQLCRHCCIPQQRKTAKTFSGMSAWLCLLLGFCLPCICWYTLLSLILVFYGPCVARGCCRISPPRFLAECHKRLLNQGSFVSAVCLVVYFIWFVLCLCVYFVISVQFLSLLYVCQ